MITDRTQQIAQMATGDYEDPNTEVWAIRACGVIVSICNESDTLSKDEIVAVLEQMLPLIPTDLLVKTAKAGEYLSSLKQNKENNA